MHFSNVYDDGRRAEAYANLGFPGTYYLAYRDLPDLFGRHVTGRAALDFGCGAGRSTRFLRSLGFDATGLDISPSMIGLATKADPAGRYVLAADGDFSALGNARFDLIFSAFAFDNIAGVRHRRNLLSNLQRRLAESGKIVLLGSTPDVYTHEWASFSTIDFPENRRAKSGDAVSIVMKDVSDARPVLDILWLDRDYIELFAACNLDLLARRAPLGRHDEPYAWVSETEIAPWVIYVLASRGEPQMPSASSSLG